MIQNDTFGKDKQSQILFELVANDKKLCRLVSTFLRYNTERMKYLWACNDLCNRVYFMKLWKQDMLQRCNELFTPEVSMFVAGVMVTRRRIMCRNDPKKF